MEFDFKNAQVRMIGAVTTYPNFVIPRCSVCAEELFRREPLSGYPTMIGSACRCERARA